MKLLFEPVLVPAPHGPNDFNLIRSSWTNPCSPPAALPVYRSFSALGYFVVRITFLRSLVFVARCRVCNAYLTKRL